MRLRDCELASTTQYLRLYSKPGTARREAKEKFLEASRPTPQVQKLVRQDFWLRRPMRLYRCERCLVRRPMPLQQVVHLQAATAVRSEKPKPGPSRTSDRRCAKPNHGRSMASG